MKKLLLVLAVAGTVAACNNESKSTEETKTDTTVAPAPAPVDTTVIKVDTTAKADTTKK